MSTPISKWLPQVVKCLQCEYIVSVAGVLGSEINDISVHRLLYGCKISGLEQMKFAETNIFAHWICHADETKEKEKKRSIGTPFIFLIILPIRSIFKRWCRRYSLAFSRIIFFFFQRPFDNDVTNSSRFQFEFMFVSFKMKYVVLHWIPVPSSLPCLCFLLLNFLAIYFVASLKFHERWVWFNLFWVSLCILFRLDFIHIE